MRNFKNYLNITEDTPITSPVTTDIIAQIDKVVDDWMVKLLYDPKSGLIGTFTAPEQRRGLWDRFKGSMANLWHGRTGENNPYLWKNKLGDDLGREELPRRESFSIEVLSLQEYRELREVCNNLEQQLNESIPGTENLRIVQLIKSAAMRLKDSLKKIMMVKPAEAVPSANNDPAAPTPVATSYPLAADQSGVGSPKPTNYPLVKDIEPKIDNSPKIHNSPPDNSKFYTTLPTNGRNWRDLNDEEKNQWNIYGGGLSSYELPSEKIRLPNILRIGDPRLVILKSYGNTRIKNMKDRKRIEEDKESFGDPIKSEQDLEDRVKEIKAKIKPGKSTTTKTGEFADSLPSVAKESPNADSSSGEPANVQPSVSKESSTKDSSGELATMQPNRINANAALTDPLTDPLTNPLTNPIQNDELDAKIDEFEEFYKNLSIQDRNFKKDEIRDDLRLMIIHLSEKLKDNLNKDIEIAKNPKEFKGLKRKIQHYLDMKNDDSENIDDWNSSEYVSYYKNKLKNPITESKSALSRKTLISLPINEKVQYLKECLKHR